MATISQRISLEGSDDIRKALEELGAAGEKAFKQIQDAAAKPITDPAAINRSKQAFDQLVQVVAKLSPQFKQLTADTQAFGTAGARASQQVTAGLNQTNQAAQQAGTGLLSASQKFGLAAVGIATAISAVVKSLTSGAGVTAQAITSQAEKLNISIPQWLKLRAALDVAGVSAEEFMKAAVPLARALDKIGLEASGINVTTFANGATVVTHTIGTMSDETKKAVTELQKFGVTQQAILSGDKQVVWQQLAKFIGDLPAGAAQAAAGMKFFGENWQKAIAVFRVGQKAVTDTTDAMDIQRKTSRQMSAEQVKAADEAASQWDDLANAIRATKDQIGALFSGPSGARAKWLTDMVDDARELLKTWFKLDAAGRAGFLKTAGDSAAARVFKILVALGQQLGGIWTHVLVPAGKTLLGIFDSMAGLFEGITGSQVAAFFITAAIAAAGLALALKGIALVLTPLSMLIGLVFSPFGAVLLAAAAAAALFWDKLKAGAQSVAALIPGELAQIGESFNKLFSGDFSGFWDQFSNAAVEAFAKIAKAAEEDKGAIGELFRGTKAVIRDLPGAILLVIKIFIGLGEVATSVAGIINKVFGTALTGTDIAVLAIIGNIIGAFGALAAIAVVAANAFGILAAAVGGPIAAAIVGAGVIIFELVRKWDDLKAHAIDCFTNIGNGITGLVSKIGELASAIGGAIWDTFAAAGIAAVNLVTNAFNGLINKIKEAVAWAAKLFSGGGGTPGETTPIPGNAAGGLIGGRGTGTSDFNLAWVSRGEHIMPARAVSQPGVLAFLEALRRSGGNLSRVLDRMGHFATGGLVSMPAFAGGGSVGGMSHVTIAFPGLPEISGLRASSGVVEQLQRAAAMAQVRSGGRKPSRYS